MTLSDSLQVISVAVVFSAVGYGLFRGLYDIIHRRAHEREEYLRSFHATVERLSSGNPSEQLASAVLLRRFFETDQNRRDAGLRIETINVISSMLRILPTGVFQKTLGDGLAYATDLTGADLQRTNLQDVFLGRKDGGSRIQLSRADLFTADLSSALLQNVDGREAIFYNAILFRTQIKDCDFSNANFRNAELAGVRFTKVRLDGADFQGASGVPPEIAERLVNGLFHPKNKEEEEFSTAGSGNGRKVFFSMPGCLTKQEEAVTKAYKAVLESRDYEVIYYQRDEYPQYGQFTRIRKSLEDAAAAIVFGFAQTDIESGVRFRGTAKEARIEHETLPTPWNGIEAGMALMRGLPVLLVKDAAVSSGVFDDKLNEVFVAAIPSDFDIRNLGTDSRFLRWLNKIE